MYDTILNETQKRYTLCLRGGAIDAAMHSSINDLEAAGLIQATVVDRWGTMDIEITPEGRRAKLEDGGAHVYPEHLSGAVNEAKSGLPVVTCRPTLPPAKPGATVFLGVEQVGVISQIGDGTFVVVFADDEKHRAKWNVGSLNEAMLAAWSTITEVREAEALAAPVFEHVPRNYPEIGDKLLYLACTTGRLDIPADQMTPFVSAIVRGLIERGTFERREDGSVAPTEHGLERFRDDQASMLAGVLMDGPKRGWEIFEKVGIESIAAIDRAMRRCRKRGIAISKTTFVGNPGDKIYCLDPRPDVPKTAAQAVSPEGRERIDRIAGETS